MRKMKKLVVPPLWPYFKIEKEKEIAKRRLQDQGLRKNKNKPSNKLLTGM